MKIDNYYIYKCSLNLSNHVLKISIRKNRDIKLTLGMCLNFVNERETSFYLLFRSECPSLFVFVC